MGKPNYNIENKVIDLSLIDDAFKPLIDRPSGLKEYNIDQIYELYKNKGVGEVYRYIKENMTKDGNKYNLERMYLCMYKLAMLQTKISSIDYNKDKDKLEDVYNSYIKIFGYIMYGENEHHIFSDENSYNQILRYIKEDVNPIIKVVKVEEGAPEIVESVDGEGNVIHTIVPTYKRYAFVIFGNKALEIKFVHHSGKYKIYDIVSEEKKFSAFKDVKSNKELLNKIQLHAEEESSSLNESDYTEKDWMYKGLKKYLLFLRKLYSDIIVGNLPTDNISDFIQKAFIAENGYEEFKSVFYSDNANQENEYKKGYLRILKSTTDLFHFIRKVETVNTTLIIDKENEKNLHSGYMRRRWLNREQDYSYMIPNFTVDEYIHGDMEIINPNLDEKLTRNDTSNLFLNKFDFETKYGISSAYIDEVDKFIFYDGKQKIKDNLNYKEKNDLSKSFYYKRFVNLLNYYLLEYSKFEMDLFRKFEDFRVKLLLDILYNLPTELRYKMCELEINYKNGYYDKEKTTLVLEELHETLMMPMNIIILLILLNSRSLNNIIISDKNEGVIKKSVSGLNIEDKYKIYDISSIENSFVFETNNISIHKFNTRTKTFIKKIINGVETEVWEESQDIECNIYDKFIFYIKYNTGETFMEVYSFFKNRLLTEEEIKELRFDIVKKVLDKLKFDDFIDFKIYNDKIVILTKNKIIKLDLINKTVHHLKNEMILSITSLNSEGNIVETEKTIRNDHSDYLLKDQFLYFTIYKDHMNRDIISITDIYGNACSINFDNFEKATTFEGKTSKNNEEILFYLDNEKNKADKETLSEISKIKFFKKMLYNNMKLTIIEDIVSGEINMISIELQGSIFDYRIKNIGEMKGILRYIALDKDNRLKILSYSNEQDEEYYVYKLSVADDIFNSDDPVVLISGSELKYDKKLLTISDNPNESGNLTKSKLYYTEIDKISSYKELLINVKDINYNSHKTSKEHEFGIFDNFMTFQRVRFNPENISRYEVLSTHKISDEFGSNFATSTENALDDINKYLDYKKSFRLYDNNNIYFLYKNDLFLFNYYETKYSLTNLTETLVGEEKVKKIFSFDKNVLNDKKELIILLGDDTNLYLVITGYNIKKGNVMLIKIDGDFEKLKQSFVSKYYPLENATIYWHTELPIYKIE